MIAAPVGRVVVVPCYDEARRLQLERFLEFRAHDVAVLFVNDGSKDQTGSLLEAFAAAHVGIGALQLEHNEGKAEAVRHGLLEAIRRGASVVGYLDADLATPPQEMLRVLDALGGRFQVALGSRVRLMGRHIERVPTRHYLGRVFATLASWSLSLPVYDTQCGAKAFRVTPALEAALSAPFESRWVFDVELIGRLLSPRTTGVVGLDTDAFVEVPLAVWTDVKGSKLTTKAMAGAALDLAKIARARRQR